MEFFTGWQYLLIDAANNFGLDKLLFEERIQWATDNLDKLEQLTDKAKKKTQPLYIKAVMAIRKAQKGIATGHVVGLDATCSGIQIMSVLTGCVKGADATGLIDPNKRADAYTEGTALMNQELTEQGIAVTVEREIAKNATMTSFYGSKEVPKRHFGEDTPELNAFYQAMYKLAPGAWDLLQTALSSWQPWALMHAWKLPDGFDARIKVMKKMEARIEVDELNHSTFTYEYYDNVGSKTGLSNAANLTHSVDAYVLRSMHRRCNYNQEMVEEAARLIQMELIERNLGHAGEDVAASREVAYYIEQYRRSTIADIVILPYLDDDQVQCLKTEHLQKLMEIIQGMLQYQPFELITVHDEFKAHPNNLNWVRWQYKEILADIADSTLLDDILSQIYGMPGHFTKLSTNLGDLIRKSNYALC